MKKFLILFFILLFAGCAVSSDRIIKLEKKVVELEEMVLMGGTEGAGASFYPFTGDLNGGGGANDLDKITGTVQGDVAFGALQGHGTWGNAFFPYVLDIDGGSGDAEPSYVASGDGGDERWVLAKIYGSEIIGKTSWGTEITGNITLGDSLIEVWGKAYIVSAACTVTLEAAATVGFGSTVLLIVRDVTETVIVEIDNADKINLHGTPLDIGDTIDSPGAAGDFIVLIATTDADGSGTNGWRTLGYGHDVWTDGGAT